MSDTRDTEIADWVIVDDLGIVDRFYTQSEAFEALSKSKDIRARVEWSPDPGEL